jgi:hypothetical protein
MKYAGLKQYMIFLIIILLLYEYASARAINLSFYAMENQGGKFNPGLRFHLC